MTDWGANSLKDFGVIISFWSIPVLGGGKMSRPRR